MRNIKILIIAVAFALAGCGVFQPSFINENAMPAVDSGERIDGIDGPVNGHFDEDGQWVPNDSAIEATYKLPDIGAGFIFDVNSMDISPSLQVELLEINTTLPYLGTLKLDAGVAYQRAYLYVGKLFTSIFEVSAGGFYGWNFEDKTYSFGFAATIIRF